MASKTATAIKAAHPGIPEETAERKATGWWRHLGTVVIGAVLVAAAMLMRDYSILSVPLVLAGVFALVSGGHAMSGESTDALRERGNILARFLATIIGAFRGRAPNGGFR